MTSFLLLVFICLCVGLVESYVCPANRKNQVPALMMADGRVTSSELSRRSVLSKALLPVVLPAFYPQTASARLESVDRPDLLPSEAGLNVIQTEKFLTTGQARRMNELLTNLERDTGFRVRVLCQNYPNTPGLAIREYWDLGKEVSLKASAAVILTFG